MLTSAGLAHAARADEEGFEAQLTKPVKQSDLLNAILRALASDAAAGRAGARGGPAPRRESDGPLHVLVAEDNATNQKLVGALLDQRGCLVTMVANGREAVEKAREQRFDLILMDVQMPEMGGLEAAAAIRRDEAAAGTHTPIVALTAHAMAGDRERCLAAGMDAYLAKPLRPDELLAMIDGFFPAAAAESAARTDVARSYVGRSDAARASKVRNPAVPPGRPVDAATLLASFGGNGKLLAEVIDVFLEDAPRQLAALKGAVAGGDAAALAASAHAMKGAIGLFSSGAAYEGAMRLLHAARAGDLSGANLVAGDVEREAQVLIDELARLRRAL
jgi:CheY-like chemotaxis protein/HPt (histidine-containing phosphotransfer) domain-containing protein